MVGTGQDHDLIILAQTHDTDTGAVTALHRDLIGVQADDDALLAAQQHVIHIVHDLDRGDLVLGGIVVADALAAAGGDAVGVDVGPAALAVLGHGQDGGVLTADADTHDLVALGQLDGAHAVAAAAHGTGILLIEADGLTVAGGNDEHIVAGGQSCPGQRIPLVQGNADQAALADVGVLLQRGALDEALLCDHGHKTALGVDFLALAEHVGDLFALGQLQQIDDVGALAGAAALGDGVALDAEQAALIGNEQDIIMGGTHEHLLHDILFLAGHAGDAAAAALLGLIGSLELALDITGLGQGINALLLSDQILDIHLAGHGLDLGAAVIAKAALHLQQLTLDDLEHAGIIGQDLFPIPDLGVQGAQLFLDLQNLQTSQTAQLQLDDGICLRVIKAELLHDGSLGLAHAALAGTDGGNQLIHDVGGLFQAFQNVGAFPGLFQVILGAAAHHLVLELDILLDHLLQGHHLGHLVVDGQHDDTHGILQLGVLVQLIQDDLGVGILAHVNHDAHSLAVGLIVQVTDALDPLFLDQVGNVLNEACLVDHVGDLGHNDLGAAILLFLNGGAAAQGDLAAAGGIGSTDAAAAHDDAGGGEIGALDVLHQAGQVDVRVLDIGHTAVNDLAQVVGRDVGGHTNGDALTAVDQQVRETAGQHTGFLLGLIKVGVPVDGILVDIGQHLHGHTAHAGLGVTVSSRGVAIHRTKVTLTIHQRVAQGEILCQTDHGIVNRCVAVGVVGTQHRTNGVGGFAVCMAGVVAALMHGVQDAAVDRLQAVAHIGQGAGHDD